MASNAELQEELNELSKELDRMTHYFAGREAAIVLILHAWLKWVDRHHPEDGITLRQQLLDTASSNARPNPQSAMERGQRDFLQQFQSLLER